MASVVPTSSERFLSGFRALGAAQKWRSPASTLAVARFDVTAAP